MHTFYVVKVYAAQFVVVDGGGSGRRHRLRPHNPSTLALPILCGCFAAASVVSRGR